MTAWPVPRRHWRSYGDDPAASFPTGPRMALMMRIPANGDRQFKYRGHFASRRGT